MANDNPWTTRYYKNGIGICRKIPGQDGLFEYKLRKDGTPVIYKRGLYAQALAAKLNAEEAKVGVDTTD